MDTRRRKGSERWFEREGEGFLQRGKPRQTRFEGPSTRRRPSERQLLRSYEGYEEEADFSEDSERSEQPD